MAGDIGFKPLNKTTHVLGELFVFESKSGYWCTTSCADGSYRHLDHHDCCRRGEGVLRVGVLR